MHPSKQELDEDTPTKRRILFISYLIVAACLGSLATQGGMNYLFERKLFEARQAVQLLVERQVQMQHDFERCKAEQTVAQPTFEDCAEMLCEPAGVDWVMGCFPVTAYTSESTSSQDACLQSCGCYRDLP